MLEFIVAAAAGLGLSAACGFRVFVPPLFAGIAARAGTLSLGSGLDWLQSDIALIVLGIAALCEGAAYLIPWFDHFLDTLATPSAAVAGILVMGSTLGEIDPWLRWTMAAIAGGGTATAIQALTVTTRAASTATTGGFANPILAIMEGISSIILSLLAILAPLFAALLVMVLFYFVARRISAIRRWWTARKAKTV